MIIDDKLKMHDLGFYQLRNKPSQKELQQYYNKKYYQEQTGSYQNNYNNDEIKYFDLKINQKAYVIDKLINYKGRLLDVGCGEGFTLQYYFNKGWDVKGIDFSQSGIDKHNPDMGKYIDVGDLIIHNQDVTHGVNSIDPDKSLDLINFTGRTTLNFSIGNFNKKKIN